MIASGDKETCGDEIAVFGLTNAVERFTVFFDCHPKKYFSRRDFMESTYKVIELIGTSPKSWEEAAKNAVDTARKTLKDLRIAEAVDFDMRVEDGKVTAFRTKVKVSFKYQD